MKKIYANNPVDTLLLIPNEIRDGRSTSEESLLVYGTYNHNNGIVNGEIVYNDLTSNKNVIKHTTGTLNIQEHNKLIYAANYNNLSIYKNTELIHKNINNKINTNISIGKYNAVTNTEGELMIFDDNLKEIQTYKLSKNSLWSNDQYNNMIVTGGEESKVFLIDIRSNHYDTFPTKMVSSIKIHNEIIYVGCYDGNMLLFDLRMNKVREIFVGGQIWGINFYSKFIVISCMHEGVKVLNYEFKSVYENKPKSMVYAACFKDNLLFFSSFYENIIFMQELDI
ncbi:hypothetical protein H311_04269 [Anncaliia algerae PRA109]|nr:hypothetical protein H311_04269 [Anncaliia algerae PRA109]